MFIKLADVEERDKRLHVPAAFSLGPRLEHVHIAMAAIVAAAAA